MSDSNLDTALRVGCWLIGTFDVVAVLFIVGCAVNAYVRERKARTRP